MLIVKRVATVVLTSGLLLGGAATAAFAGGAGGGDFTCSQSGVPGWGTVTSQYNHPTLAHYATAVGNSRTTVSKSAGINAVASQGRAPSGNACYWGYV